MGTLVILGQDKIQCNGRGVEYLLPCRRDWTDMKRFKPRNREATTALARCRQLLIRSGSITDMFWVGLLSPVEIKILQDKDCVLYTAMKRGGTIAKIPDGFTSNDIAVGNANKRLVFIRTLGPSFPLPAKFRIQKKNTDAGKISLHDFILFLKNWNRCRDKVVLE